ncbi:MAG: hypothetical protein OXQ89_19805 [Rhodospirillaceae bacterium]|nr:hypothetical protein [Rhodospirillaceae bacterium]MDD9999994.1 hypothetical protein [Rhodospirillaceae bacterium]
MTRFRGNLNLTMKGVHDIKGEKTLSTGVSRANGRAGRTPEELSRKFEPTAQSIINWVARAGRDEGKRKDGLTSAEREQLPRLRKANRQLRLEREILATAAAWFAQETAVNSKRSSTSLKRTRPPIRFG